MKDGFWKITVFLNKIPASEAGIAIFGVSYFLRTNWNLQTWIFLQKFWNNEFFLIRLEVWTIFLEKAASILTPY